MPQFPSAKQAFEWALEMSQLRGGARAIQYNPDWIGSLGVPMDYAYLDAIQILSIAEKHDKNNGKLSWFVAYFCPIPIIERPTWTEHEMLELVERVERFECELAKADFIPHCGKHGCKHRRAR